MAENKKSFIGYADWGDTFEMLDDAEAGKLIKHFFKYIQDENPILEDKLLQVAFHPIKLQLKRDLVKWDEIKDKKSDSGVIGNLKRWAPDLYLSYINKEITLEQAESIAKCRKVSHPDNKVSQSVANIAVNVNVNDTVNVIDTTPNEIIFPLNGFKPDQTFLNMELSETQIGAGQQYIKITKYKDVSKDFILGLWSIFKLKEFTGKKYYPDVGGIYSHFINTLKYEKLEENKQPEKQYGNTVNDRLKAAVQKQNRA